MHTEILSLSPLNFRGCLVGSRTSILKLEVDERVIVVVVLSIVVLVVGPTVDVELRVVVVVTAACIM